MRSDTIIYHTNWIHFLFCPVPKQYYYNEKWIILKTHDTQTELLPSYFVFRGYFLCKYIWLWSSVTYSHAIMPCWYISKLSIVNTYYRLYIKTKKMHNMIRFCAIIAYYKIFKIKLLNILPMTSQHSSKDIFSTFLVHINPKLSYNHRSQSFNP